MGSLQNGDNKTSNDELFQAQVHLYRHLYSIVTPMSIKWAVDLGIPDIIHNHGQPITLPQLVSSLCVPQQKVTCVGRFMRLLAHNGYFAIVKTDDDSEEAYALTRVSELLVKGSNHCLTPMVEMALGDNPLISNVYHELAKWTLREDRTIVDMAIGGGSMWDLFHQNPEILKVFNEGMESDSHVVRLALKDCKSVFEGLDSLVDVGGGTGNTAKIICGTFPKLKCTVLDLPQVAGNLQDQHNLSYVGGNMFESIPQADAVLLKWILHDWSDDECIKILKNCKEAISSKGKGGKVIIIDVVINEKQDDHEMTELKLSFDIVMMTGFNGKERNEKEWKDLFLASGFKDYKIFSIFGFRSLIELYV